MYYYGACYYDPRISIFISVDPQAEKFVGRSPYEYSFNKPINFIDPTGMSPTGGPGGPPVRNFYIVLDYHITGDGGNDVRRDIIRFEEMKEKGWETIYSSDINTTAYTLRTTFTDEKFDNIIIESHTSYSSSDIQNFYFLFQSDNNKIDESTLITHNTLRLGVQRSTLSLINITNSLKEDDNLVFNTCNLGMDSRFMDGFNRLTENKFNIYYPIGFSKHLWLPSETEGTPIYSPEMLFNSNILDGQGGHLSPANGGENRKINSIKFNSDGIQCE